MIQLPCIDCNTPTDPAQLFCPKCLRKRLRTRLIIAFLLFVYLCVVATIAVRAAPLRCTWIDGTEVDCLVDFKLPSINTIRIIEAPLFADSFE